MVLTAFTLFHVLRAAHFETLRRLDRSFSDDHRGHKRDFAVLAIAILARYELSLAGGWRRTYAALR
jgi:hypothetical protein